MPSSKFKSGFNATPSNKNGTSFKLNCDDKFLYMNTELNLIQDKNKNNDEKNNCSVKGFYWNEKQADTANVTKLQENLNLDLCILKPLHLPHI